MSPAALAASRAIAVLDFFTAHPRRSFTLSELSVSLGINLASLSSVLRSLTDTGYLTRHPRHKTYELGAALLAIGQAANQRHPFVELARPEMRRLAETIGTECVGSVVVGDEILMLALAGRPSARSYALALGDRVPLVPPFGQVFLAWSNPAAIESWITRGLGESVRSPERGRLLDSLRHVHARGYAVNLASPELDKVRVILAGLARRPRDGALRAQLAVAVQSVGDDYELVDEKPDRRYPVSLISAPVFGENGEVVFAITACGLPEVSGHELRRIGDEIASAGRMVTRQIGGVAGGAGRLPRADVRPAPAPHARSVRASA
ncbi:IclR family transcriptional regulator [Amycolatopsis sp. GM8]|uniref:IclR family transcriptional regulator n=1 Tax=Amycolatopsis sp. GM8 TaxID=2896530 RepID=UPI001F01D536|nr:helix-turn-helix domain-containing protein [Amycolatopsis sp. GM8]